MPLWRMTSDRPLIAHAWGGELGDGLYCWWEQFDWDHASAKRSEAQAEEQADCDGLLFGAQC